MADHSPAPEYWKGEALEFTVWVSLDVSCPFWISHNEGREGCGYKKLFCDGASQIALFLTVIIVSINFHSRWEARLCTVCFHFGVVHNVLLERYY